MENDERIKMIEEAKERMKQLNNQPYQRGDVELIMQEKMWISILEKEIAKEQELGRPLNTEEHHQNLRNHGWTVGHSDE